MRPRSKPPERRLPDPGAGDLPDRRRRRPQEVVNHAGVVVFPAAALTVIVSAVLRHGFGLAWWGAEEAAAMVAVLGYFGAKLEGWRRWQRTEELGQSLRR